MFTASPVRSFEECEVEGKRGEKRIAGILRGAGFKVTERFGHYRQDMCAIKGDLVFRIEVKNEDRYANSGNIIVELRQGEPPRRSGIANSESTVCIHTLGDRAAIYRTQAMRCYLSDKLMPQHLTYEHLDLLGKVDNKNRGVKLPISTLLPYRWFWVGPIEQLPQSAIWNE